MIVPISDLLNAYDAAKPLEEASTIPSSWYLDKRMSELERERVFARNWVAVGRVDQVVAAGEFFTFNLAGEPLVVVRGTDGVLRGFYNVCRHHAAAVADAPCGTVQHLRCPYHGWTYGLDGTLKGAPEFGGVCNFNREENSLVPVRVATWELFVFVTLNNDATSLEETLGHLTSRVAALNLTHLKFFTRKSYTLDCNWKVYLDNYLDGGYHVPHLHKSLNSVLDYKEYKIENGERYSLQSSPMVASSDASVANTRVGDHAYYYWLYPNFMINFYEGVVDTNLVLPLGPDRCEVIFDFYFADVSDARLDYNGESVAVSDRVQDEDVGICESVQIGLRSRAYQAGRLSVRREAGEHLFHRLLSRDLKQTP